VGKREVEIPIIIAAENSSQHVSDVHDSKGFQEPELSQNNIIPKVRLEASDQVDEEDEDLNYHFHGKNEILSNISEEHLLEHLDYLGEITSCNKVEKYLMYSDYEPDSNSDGFSFNSSQAHSEQVTAPLNKKKNLSKLTNNSFSEPDLFRLSSRLLLQPTLLTHEEEDNSNMKTWHRIRTRGLNFRQTAEMPVIKEVGSIDTE